jgi:hypothetical protein
VLMGVLAACFVKVEFKWAVLLAFEINSKNEVLVLALIYRSNSPAAEPRRKQSLKEAAAKVESKWPYLHPPVPPFSFVSSDIGIPVSCRTSLLL